MTIVKEALYEQAAAFIEDNKENMLQFWSEIVNMESGNMQKPKVDLLCERIGQELALSDVDVNIVEMETMGNFLHGSWNSQSDKAPILFLGHMDTVFKEGAVAKNPFRIEDGKAYGPGALDMKAGLTIAVFVIKALQQIGYKEHPIKIAFAGDEENGHRMSTASQEIAKACQDVCAAFNFETGYLNDGVVVGRKGSYRVNVSVKGIPAHSGNAPEKGRNAILEMSHKVIELQKLNDYENGTSLNVGIISGGTVVNTVPDTCEISIDVRYTQKDRLAQMAADIKRIVDTVYVDGTSSTLTECGTSVTMESSPAVMKLFEHMKTTAEAIGYGTLVPIQVGGWSDACLVASEDVPVVCGLGVKGEFNHAPYEYGLVDSLFARAKLMLASVLELENFLGTK